MAESKYSKGSEWRKWDLHIHSPASGFGTQSDYPIFIENLKNSEADVIGINDYATIEGYSKILDLGGIPDKVLFPVVEFRMNNKINHKSSTAIQGGVSINFHLIFDNLLTTKQIVTELNSLECLIEGGEETKLGHIEHIERKKLSFDFFKTVEALKKSTYIKGRFLVWIPYDEYGGIDAIDPVNDAFFKLGIINKAQILGSANQKQIQFFLSERCLAEVGKNIPCIKGSDSHEIDYPFGRLRDEESKPIKKFCWIKADPTFFGLMQIVYEPLERVKIQETNPELDFEKPYFSHIHINEDEIIFEAEDDLIFGKNEKGIPLNQNLVAIIGGRGEGKSMLTDFISSSFIDQKHSKDGEFRKDGNLSIDYLKTNQIDDERLTFQLTKDKHAVEFIYINQGRLKERVEQKDKKSNLADSIRRLAKLAEPKFSPDLNQKVLSTIDEYVRLKKFFEEKDDAGNFINSLEYLQDRESSINEFISNITTKENKDKLTRYSENLNKINVLNQKSEELKKLKAELLQTVQHLNTRILEINGSLNKIPELNSTIFQTQTTAIDEWVEEIIQSNIEITQSIESVKVEFKDYKGDLTTLLNDIDKFQRSLFEIREQIKDIRTKQTRHANLKKSLLTDEPGEPSLVSQIKSDYVNQKKKLEDEWMDFNKIDEKSELNAAQKNIMKKLLDDLTIDVIIDFDINNFYEQITNCINGAVWRVKNNKDAQQDWFKIRDIDSFFEFTRTRFLNEYNNNAFYPESFTEIFLNEEIRRKFIKVYPVLKYQGKDLNKISVGQKGTVYLKMMLATEAFSKPIVFDQPEDDLDNEFIMNDLIDLFKNLKKYRQVIIVTHNANLVVNADAEQIIIAKNDKGRLLYNSGSLENQEINDSICKILEGGRQAFEKRRDKYKYSY